MKQSTEHRIEKRRIHLTPLQTIGHYSFALFPLLFPAMDLYFQVTDKHVVNSFSSLANFICVGLSVLIIVLKHKELISERIYDSRTDEQFKDAVFATANTMKWNIMEFDHKKLKAIATNGWIGRDYSIISVVRVTKYVEVQSNFDMIMSLPDVFGINKKHRRVFLNNYILSSEVNDLNDRAINDIKRKEQAVENDSEWSLKNTLKRIIAYVFSLAFLSLGIFLWKYDGFSLVVPILIVLGTFYIVFDLYVMYTKVKNAG